MTTKQLEYPRLRVPIFERSQCALSLLFCSLAMASCGGVGTANPGTGGATTSSGGASAGTGGAAAGSGGRGAGTGGANTGTGGRTGSGGAVVGGTGGAPGAGGTGSGTPGTCPAGTFPTADPAKAGPFAVTTEMNVGPDGAFTLVRPTNLTQSGLCHPLVTWGNGHGATPSAYSRVLNQLASHGIVVIASNSSMVSMGDPPPMLAGVTWVIEQNSNPSSVLFGRIDTAHIGATGHSEGAFATMRAGADARIITIAPIEGSMSSRNLHGPVLLMCGGMDATLSCEGHVTSFNGITNQPIMLANQLAATHGNWLGFGSSTLNPFIVALTAWMRVHLMGDVALRPMFYGATCTLCQDTATWAIMKKMMD